MPWKMTAIALAAGLVASAAAPAQEPPGAPAPPSYSLWEFGTMPRPAFKRVLLGVSVVEDELKLTTAQRIAVGFARVRESAAIQEADRENPGREKFRAARAAIFQESMAATLKGLEPWQRDRLDQIQLQSQGPMAFDEAWAPDLASDGPKLVRRLKLDDDQIGRVKTIAAEGYKAIEQAATLPIVLDPKAGAPTTESIGKLVKTPEFLAAKRKAREDARKAWASVMQEIERVLTEPQRVAYREMLGPPFDTTRIRFDDEATEDANNVAGALGVGGGGGQRADPDFDTKVARPAYADKHPRVLFDEAHNNFHTTAGRYKPFAEVIGNDGYKVVPNKGKFTGELLAGGDVLIIANALGAGGMGQAGASDSAFSEAECDAVRDWVRGGGSLLLITDHAPFGSAAESLAKRFGVEMSKGYTSDPANSEGGDTSLVFTREKELLGDHPITRGRDASERVNRIQTFTGQSLKGPAGSVAILKLGDTATDEGPDGKPTPAAGRAQGVAFAFGDGRVVVLGEAAELSAQLIGTERFGMNVPGLDNRQMALNILHWLSGLLEPRAGSPKKSG